MRKFNFGAAFMRLFRPDPLTEEQEKLVYDLLVQLMPLGAVDDYHDLVSHPGMKLALIHNYVDSGSGWSWGYRITRKGEAFVKDNTLPGIPENSHED